MEKLVITGGNVLKGTLRVSGAKNAALKVLVAACLTNEKVTINNVPLISDFYVMLDILKELGAVVSLQNHTVTIQMREFVKKRISIEKAALARSSVMFIAPLLVRTGEALIPNPGGCRLGARPVDRLIEGVEHMNTTIKYLSEDGYFHAKTTGLRGINYTFAKNTHVGTETMILAAVCAEGITILKNAAEEPEIDDLINLLNNMGGNVRRSAKREITIEGVKKLHGGNVTIQPDRNEIVTFAVAAIVTKGDIFIEDAQEVDLEAFLQKLDEAQGGYEKKENGIRFFYKAPLQSVDVTTGIYPGFMTDWQAPWAVLMTQANGLSIVHETVFENKMGYVKDLKKMGAKVQLFNPQVENSEEIYNFNLSDNDPSYYHAVKITGPKQLHDGVLTTLDIRAGAAVVLAALAAKGTSTIFGVEKLDRGYEQFEARLALVGAKIERIKGE